MPTRRKYNFTDEQILEIRRLRGEGWTQKKLAERFGCSMSLIAQISLGKKRPDLGGVVKSRRKKYRDHSDKTPEEKEALQRAETREYMKLYREKHRGSPAMRAYQRRMNRMYARNRGTGGWPVPEGAVCELCGAEKKEIPFTTRTGDKTTRCSLVMDHDHDTGQIRAPLCHSCNQLLGRIEKNLDLVERMLAYRDHWKEVYLNKVSHSDNSEASGRGRR